MIAGANLASLLQAFFTNRLMTQRQASPHTIASYRDTFCLLLRFAQEQLGKAPSSLALTDVDAPLIGAFLQHLEQRRGNNPRSRNVRLAAIHAFFRYTALHVPDQSVLGQQVLAIPPKRFERTAIEFLIRPEIEALATSPTMRSWLSSKVFDYAETDPSSCKSTAGSFPFVRHNPGCGIMPQTMQARRVDPWRDRQPQFGDQVMKGLADGLRAQRFCVCLPEQEDRHLR